MRPTLEGGAATEALMLYASLGRTGGFDAARVRRDVLGRTRRAVRRIRAEIGLPRVALALVARARSAARPRPRAARRRGSGTLRASPAPGRPAPPPVEAA